MDAQTRQVLMRTINESKDMHAVFAYAVLVDNLLGDNKSASDPLKDCIKKKAMELSEDMTKEDFLDTECTHRHVLLPLTAMRLLRFRPGTLHEIDRNTHILSDLSGGPSEQHRGFHGDG